MVASPSDLLARKLNIIFKFAIKILEQLKIHTEISSFIIYYH
jgi:hypothetical protein